MDGSWSCNGPTESKPRTRYGSVGLPRHDFEHQEVTSFAHESKNNQPVNTAGRVVVGGGRRPLPESVCPGEDQTLPPRVSNVIE